MDTSGLGGWPDQKVWKIKPPTYPTLDDQGLGAAWVIFAPRLGCGLGAPNRLRVSQVQCRQGIRNKSGYTLAWITKRWLKLKSWYFLRSTVLSRVLVFWVFPLFLALCVSFAPIWVQFGCNRSSSDLPLGCRLAGYSSADDASMTCTEIHRPQAF